MKRKKTKKGGFLSCCVKIDIDTRKGIPLPCCVENGVERGLFLAIKPDKKGVPFIIASKIIIVHDKIDNHLVVLPVNLKSQNH